MRRWCGALALLCACGGGEIPYNSAPSQAGAAGSSAGSAGQAGSAQAGQSGSSGQAGSAGQAGGGQSGSSGQSGAGQAGQAGSAGQAGAAGEAGSGGAAGEAGAAGQGGASGASGQAGSAGSAGSGPDLATTLAKCQGSDQAFVRRAIQAVLGRKAYGQAEVQVYLDLMAAIDGIDAGVPGADLRPARRVAVIEMMAREEYLFRWIDAYRDILRVQRTEDMANPGCYGTTMRADGTAVAELVRDQPPDALGGDGKGPFTMRDLLLSSLKLDDVSPVYTANIFSMLVLTYPGANAAPDKLELARRSDFGAWFDGVYLRRDSVCLRCHNGEFSVTYSAEADKNRHFPVPGHLEQALFGKSTGPDATDNADGAARMHAPLRFDNFVNAGSARPWGWTDACGTFRARGTVPADIAKVDARFGNISGTKTSAWDLSSSLQEGFRKLRLHGLSRGPDGLIPDPDEAFAYLVVLNTVEQVWREVMGTPLTIANYFPRNAAARDQLLLLAEGFVASGFSHRTLLFQILQSPYFNLAPLDDTCWPEPYALPALFDPWTTAAQDPAARRNSPADAVVPHSPRTTLLSAYRALDWANPAQSSFPDRFSEEGEFQASIGVFLKNAEPGFRGLDFQGRLGWEARLGSCQKLPGNNNPDLIDQIFSLIDEHPSATVRDLVIALKDRLTGDASVVDPDEQTALEAMLGVSLDTPAASLKDESRQLRRLCGVLLASPQFLLHGVVAPDQSTVPMLTPTATSYDSLCQQMASFGLPDGLKLTCQPGSLNVAKP